jgi:hypothetical protein
MDSEAEADETRAHAEAVKVAWMGAGMTVIGGLLLVAIAWLTGW